MSAMSGVGTSRPAPDSSPRPRAPGLHELAADVDRLGGLAGLRERLALLGRGAGQRVGVAGAARRSTSPRSRWPAEPEPPAGPAAPAGAGAAAAVCWLLRLPAPRAARRPRWSTSRQPVYSSESVGSCVERLLVLRLRVGAVDVLVAAGVAQQLGHAALGAGRRGQRPGRGSSGLSAVGAWRGGNGQAQRRSPCRVASSRLARDRPAGRAAQGARRSRRPRRRGCRRPRRAPRWRRGARAARGRRAACAARRRGRRGRRRGRRGRCARGARARRRRRRRRRWR